MITVSDKQKRVIKFLLTTIAVYLSFKYLLPLFLPFLVAYFMAWILRPMAGFLHRKLRIPLFLGGGIGLIGLIGILGTALFFLIKLLLKQLTRLFQNIPIYEAYIHRQFGGICDGFDDYFGFEVGTALNYMSTGVDGIYTKIQTELLPAITEKTFQMIVGLAVIGGIALIVIVAALLWVKDMEEYKAGLRKSEFYPEMHKITKKLSETGIAYMKTQGIVISLIACLCVVGLSVIKNPYALIIGIGVAIFDALPVLGSGMILIPWAIVMLISKNFFNAAVLITLYVLCQVIREFLEPRLLGDKLGISPILSLMTMYVGVKLFGVAGIFLGPLGYVVIRTVCSDNQHLVPSGHKKLDKSTHSD